MIGRDEYSALNLYLKEMSKYKLLSQEELKNEYENINLKKELLILNNNVLDVNKLFNLISNEEDYLLVESYIKENCINKYPQTKEDINLINKLNSYNKNFTNKNIDLKNQLILYKKYKEAREKVINCNLRLVVSTAKTYSGFCDLADIIGAGNEGLIKAVDKYDSNSEYVFSSYALRWIKNDILSFINEKSKLIRIPIHLKMEYIKLAKNIEKINTLKGYELSTEELAKELNISEKQIKKFYRDSVYDNITSINKELNDDGDTYERYIEDKKDPYEEINNSEKEIVEELLSVLSDRERYVIECRNGLNNREIQTLKEIGETLNITRQSINKIEIKAMEKIKTRYKKISR